MWLGRACGVWDSVLSTWRFALGYRSSRLLSLGVDLFNLPLGSAFVGKAPKSDGVDLSSLCLDMRVVSVKVSELIAAHSE